MFILLTIGVYVLAVVLGVVAVLAWRLTGRIGWLACEVDDLASAIALCAACQEEEHQKGLHVELEPN